MKRLTFVLCGVVFVALVFLSPSWAAPPLVAHGNRDLQGKPGLQKVIVEGEFKIERLVEPGLPTVIEFYSETCSSCKKLTEKHYPQFLKARPDVAIKLIKLPKPFSPKAILKKYKVNIELVPFIIVYGPDGKVIAKDDGESDEGCKFLYKWMNEELMAAGGNQSVKID